MRTFPPKAFAANLLGGVCVDKRHAPKRFVQRADCIGKSGKPRATRAPDPADSKSETLRRFCWLFLKSGVFSRPTRAMAYQSSASLPLPLKGTVSNPTTRDIKAQVAHLLVGKPILLSHVVSLVAYEIIKQGRCKSRRPSTFTASKPICGGRPLLKPLRKLSNDWAVAHTAIHTGWSWVFRSFKTISPPILMLRSGRKLRIAATAGGVRR